MVQSPSWEANWFAASQKIPRISRNPKVHYCTHKRPPTVSILGQPNPVHIPTSHLLKTHPNIVCCTMFPLETLPPPTPGDPNGGVVYLRFVLSPEQASRIWVLLKRIFLQWGVINTSPNPQAGGPPLVGCPRLLIQSIRSYPPYRRPFLYPQSEDAPCRDDRDPLHGTLSTVQTFCQNHSFEMNVMFRWNYCGYRCKRLFRVLLFFIRLMPVKYFEIKMEPPSAACRF